MSSERDELERLRREKDDRRKHRQGKKVDIDNHRDITHSLEEGRVQKVLSERMKGIAQLQQDEAALRGRQGEIAQLKVGFQAEQKRIRDRKEADAEAARQKLRDAEARLERERQERRAALQLKMDQDKTDRVHQSTEFINRVKGEEAARLTAAEDEHDRAVQAAQATMAANRARKEAAATAKREAGFKAAAEAKAAEEQAAAEKAQKKKVSGIASRIAAFDMN